LYFVINKVVDFIFLFRRKFSNQKGKNVKYLPNRQFQLSNGVIGLIDLTVNFNFCKKDLLILCKFIDRDRRISSLFVEIQAVKTQLKIGKR